MIIKLNPYRPKTVRNLISRLAWQLFYQKTINHMARQMRDEIDRELIETIMRGEHGRG